MPWKEYSFLVLDLEKSEWNKDEHQSVSPLRICLLEICVSRERESSLLNVIDLKLCLFGSLVYIFNWFQTFELYQLKDLGQRLIISKVQG